VNNLLITIPAAIIPSVLLLWFFYSRDKYPEPPRVVFATFGLGVLTVIPVLVVALPLGFALQLVDNPLIFGLGMGSLAAGIPEEFFKFLVIYLYCMRHSAFDEPMDGLVYGATASLGFATLENIMYCSQGGLIIAIVRALTAVPMHATVGAIMGYYCGRARFTPEKRGSLLLAAYCIPMLLHSLYDFPLLAMMKYFGTKYAPQDGVTPEVAPIDGLYALGGIGFAFLMLLISVVMAIVLAYKMKKLQTHAPAPLPEAL
jgi:RsiW-degrading membrane proteinase PrsW (M82 family)